MFKTIVDYISFERLPSVTNRNMNFCKQWPPKALQISDLREKSLERCEKATRSEGFWTCKYALICHRFRGVVQGVVGVCGNHPPLPPRGKKGRRDRHNIEDNLLILRFLVQVLGERFLVEVPGGRSRG